VWDLATRIPLAPLPPSIVDVSPDGAGTVVRGLREIAADVSAGVELHLGSSSDAAFVLAPDRRSIVVLGGLGSAEEYSVPEGHLLFSDTAVCTAATFTFDSNHLILPRPDGAVVESPARHRDEVLARARRFVFRTATNEERGAFALPPAP
jgi:hypothetical protein